MSVLVVIVNYRTAKLVADCLRTLAAERLRVPDLRVTVVDNASGDDSPAVLAEAIEAQGCGDWVRVLALDHNPGFAGGNNAAIREELESGAPAEFVHLLNPDTLVREGAVEELVRFLREHSQAGIAGSRIEDGQGRVEGSAHDWPTPWNEFLSGAKVGWLDRWAGRSHAPSEKEVAHRCQWVTGASLMVRREVIEQIGLMDQSYFLYFEEVEFCHRAQRAGWSVWHVPTSRVVHLEGQATGINQRQRRRTRHWFDSRRRFFVTAYGIRGLVLADALWAMGRTILGVRRLVRLGGAGHVSPEGFAWDLLWGDCKALLTGRVPTSSAPGAKP